MGGHATKQMAVRVIRRLRSAGHEALLAGGCVRDMLLGIRPADYDVATSATPQQVRELFGRVLMVGAKFGVAMVLFDRRRVEVTTFRCDVSYSDGRRPDSVRFVTAREDASRRDFTINGMFYDPLADRVVDYVGGRQDLAARVVRAIGDALQRFDEDYLRMLRAVRFAARFGFAIEPNTEQALRRLAARITQISGERIREELEKMLARPTGAQAVQKLHELGLLRAVLPELYASTSAWPAAQRRLLAVAPRADVTLNLAALLAGLPGGDLARIIRRWGGSNELRGGLVWLAQNLHEWGRLADGPLAEIKKRMANRHWPILLALWRLEEPAQTGHDEHCRIIGRRIRGIAPAQAMPPPLVSGDDLQALGFKPGRRLGDILRRLYDAQLNGEFPDRPAALSAARALVRRSEE